MSGTYQRKDHLYQRAKAEGFRSRAAYKLIELDKKYKLLSKGAAVLDLGCFPGGWLQVAVKAVGAEGTVVGIDLKEVEPIAVKSGKAPVILQGDLTDPQLQEQLREAAGREFDTMLSDMSPPLTGVKFRDQVRSAELVLLALEVANRQLRVGGALVAKVFPSAEADAVAAEFKRAFKKFARHSAESSRTTSNEMYFVGREFRGLESR